MISVLVINTEPELSNADLATAETVMQQTLGYSKPEINLSYASRNDRNMTGIHKLTIKSRNDAELLKTALTAQLPAYEFTIQQRILVRWMIDRSV